MTVWLGVVALICAGAALAVQAPINAALSRGLGDATLASAASFLVGFLVMAAVCALRGAWPGAGAVGQVPLWAWVGGSMGAFYITVLIVAVPLTGALTAAAATILGQMVMAMLLDRFGAFGLPVQEITWQRLAGLALVLGGLVLSRS
jgi:transporter family-2 protein